MTTWTDYLTLRMKMEAGSLQRPQIFEQCLLIVEGCEGGKG